MVDEQIFRRDSDAALDQLKQRLIDGEDLGGYETEENNGVLNVVFDAPKAKFVFTPNTPVRQIWISALSTSFKLDWVDGTFVLPKTGEALDVLTERLIKEHTDDDTFEL